jgi:hypothetical protein
MGYQAKSGLNESNGSSLLPGLLDVAIAIANERRDTLQNMRHALMAGDDQTALKCARKLCGLHDEKCN